MKHYFYVGHYDLCEKGNAENTRIFSKFSGVIEVGNNAKPGEVYSTIIKEWYEKIEEVFFEDGKEYHVKLLLEKMERID